MSKELLRADLKAQVHAMSQAFAMSPAYLRGLSRAIKPLAALSEGRIVATGHAFESERIEAGVARVVRLPEVVVSIGGIEELGGIVPASLLGEATAIARVLRVAQPTLPASRRSRKLLINVLLQYDSGSSWETRFAQLSV